MVAHNTIASPTLTNADQSSVQCVEPSVRIHPDQHSIGVPAGPIVTLDDLLPRQAHIRVPIKTSSEPSRINDLAPLRLGFDPRSQCATAGRLANTRSPPARQSPAEIRAFNAQKPVHHRAFSFPAGPALIRTLKRASDCPCWVPCCQALEKAREALLPV